MRFFEFSRHPVTPAGQSPFPRYGMMTLSAMSIDRRKFLMGGFALPALARKERIGPRPNILLIVADGLGSWMLGCGGNKEIRTPNIDQFAQAGTRFQNHLACTPSSSPSLATL